MSHCLTGRVSNGARNLFGLAIVFLCGTALAQHASRRVFLPEDVQRLQTVGDIALSPDGQWIAYRVGTTDIEKDETSSDLFMVSWDGSTRIQLTHTMDSGEGHPRFSPDGKYLAFIAARNDGKGDEADNPKGKSQVWLLNRSGGEAERLTELPGGVSGFEWAPDSSRLVLVSRDPEEKDDDVATLLTTSLGELSGYMSHTRALNEGARAASTAMKRI